MKNEIESAANFLSNMLKLHSGLLSPCQLDQFKAAISLCLESHYQSHWFPDRPTKGSGYRCIRINHKMDPIISQAGQSCGIDSQSLRSIFPNELTLWVDPSEVAYRIGENGSICVLFDGQHNDNDRSDQQQHHSHQSHQAKHQQHRSPHSKQQQQQQFHNSGSGQSRSGGRGSPYDSQSISSSTSTMSSPSPSSSPDWVRSYGTSPDNWKAAERRASPESVMAGAGFAAGALDTAMFSYHPHAVGAGHAAHFAFNAGVVNQAVAGSGHRSGPVPGQHFHYNWVGSPFRA
jgi:protein Tob/BTG